MSLLLTEDPPPPALGTFALTSLISANAVERLVPLNSQNLTTQSNTSVLGLSDFEMQRIGVAAAVSFLGGVIQVSILKLGNKERETVTKKRQLLFYLLKSSFLVN